MHCRREIKKCLAALTSSAIRSTNCFGNVSLRTNGRIIIRGPESGPKWSGSLGFLLTAAEKKEEKNPTLAHRIPATRQWSALPSPATSPSYAIAFVWAARELLQRNASGSQDTLSILYKTQALTWALANRWRLSHNQNLVSKWHTQTHAMKRKSGRTDFRLGPSPTNLHLHGLIVARLVRNFHLAKTPGKNINMSSSDKVLLKPTREEEEKRGEKKREKTHS